MPSYDDFAWFYNRYWNEEFHGLADPILDRILFSRLPDGARVLDICCGTGYLAALLETRGFRVTGVDDSPEMIRYARENAPRSEFLLADATDFRLPAEFDAAVSTFDSLNHLLSCDALLAAFRNAAAALKPGGLFGFDMLLEGAYQTNWGESFALVRADHVLTITGSGYDFRSRLAHCTVTMFRFVEERWLRSDVTIEERCYTPQEIGTALEQAGFGEVCCYHAEDLGMAGQLGEGRAFFVAAKE